MKVATITVYMSTIPENEPGGNSVTYTALLEPTSTVGIGYSIQEALEDLPDKLSNFVLHRLDAVTQEDVNMVGHFLVDQNMTYSEWLKSNKVKGEF
jgi:hypothetical protein